jgi:hypothetical protein
MVLHYPYFLLFINSFILLHLHLNVAIINLDIVTKLRGFSPQANYTDRATAACRRS